MIAAQVSSRHWNTRRVHALIPPGAARLAAERPLRAGLPRRFRRESAARRRIVPTHEWIGARHFRLGSAPVLLIRFAGGYRVELIEKMTNGLVYLKSGQTFIASRVVGLDTGGLIEVGLPGVCMWDAILRLFAPNVLQRLGKTGTLILRSTSLES